jgi:hypothetical protein
MSQKSLWCSDSQRERTDDGSQLHARGTVVSANEIGIKQLLHLLCQVAGLPFHCLGSDMSATFRLLLADIKTQAIYYLASCTSLLSCSLDLKTVIPIEAFSSSGRTLSRIFGP